MEFMDKEAWENGRFSLESDQLSDAAQKLSLIHISLFKAVTRYLDWEVVQKIGEVNRKLHKITMGDLNVKIDVHSSREFFELSRYINEMLQSLLANDRKMSYVLGKTDMHIGVYE